MSVVFFSSEELGNVAAFLARRASAHLSSETEADEDLKRLSYELAAYSVGNAAAYAYRYPSDKPAPKSVRVDLILEWARTYAKQTAAKVLVENSERARGTIGLLSYNGPEGEGLERFRGQTAYRKAMVNLLGRAYSKVNRALETKEKGIGWENGYGLGQD